MPEPDYSDPKEVFAFAGLALHAAQVLEMELTNLAVGLRRIAHQEGGSPAEIDAWFADYEMKTFGGLATAIRKLQPLPPAVEALVERALDARNRLAHRFFREHDAAMLSEHGRRCAVDELRAMVLQFKEAEAASVALSQPLWSRFGVTPELIAQELARMNTNASLRDSAV